jgi:hypothetical protein
VCCVSRHDESYFNLVHQQHPAYLTFGVIASEC